MAAMEGNFAEAPARSGADMPEMVQAEDGTGVVDALIGEANAST